jgi:hypothetical protein
LLPISPLLPSPRPLFSTLSSKLAIERGADAAVYAWAVEVFRARMRSAAAELNQKGFSSRSPPPPFLSQECFSEVPPNGFKLG